MSLTRLMPTPPGLSDALLLEFFLVFARFEYAMKASGFVKPNTEGAEPDWQRLINQVQAHDAEVTAPLLAAGAYLIEAPPKKQVRTVDGGLDWSEVRCNDKARQVSCLLWSVKRVRNNLFHGGKFDLLPELSHRNKRLLEDSLRVIERLLELPVCRPIRDKYFAYAVEEA